jgi:hypothetical protein
MPMRLAYGFWAWPFPFPFPCDLAFFIVVAHGHKNGDARSDHEDDEVFVWGEFAAVEEDVHDHHRDELTRLSEDHGGV